MAKDDTKTGGASAKGKSGRSSKNNKTAHVLNLLTEVGDPPKRDDAASPLNPDTEPKMEPIDSAVLADQIRDALTQELESEEKAQSVPKPVQAAHPQSAPEPVQAAHPEPVQAAHPQSAPEPAQSEPSQTQAHSSEVTYFNVMQALVEEQVDKYMQLLGVCTCPRCRVDVVALSLTKLPAKYVVVRKNEEIPMLTVYEGRYHAAVISQIMWACRQVQEYPRHEPFR